MSDPHILQRFVDAQAPLFDQVRQELQNGRKCGHWMWFVFPQLAGLGHSAMARRYAITSPAEAAAYLDHPVLGSRLRDCCRWLLAVPDRSARQIMGTPDDLKLRSCMTLFAHVAPQETLFAAVLRRFFDGKGDPATIARLYGTEACSFLQKRSKNFWFIVPCRPPSCVG